MWLCLHVATFRHVSRTLACDRQTDRHMTMAYTSIGCSGTLDVGQYKLENLGVVLTSRPTLALDNPVIF